MTGACPIRLSDARSEWPNAQMKVLLQHAPPKADGVVADGFAVSIALFTQFSLKKLELSIKQWVYAGKSYVTIELGHKRTLEAC